MGKESKKRAMMFPGKACQTGDESERWDCADQKSPSPTANEIATEILK
jgi:hypothetical protein